MTTLKDLSPEQQAEVLRKAAILDELIELRGMATRGRYGYYEYNQQPRGQIRRLENRTIKEQLFIVPGACHVGSADEARKNGKAITEIMNRLEELK